MLTVTSVFAQRPYWCVTPGTKLDYTVYDAKGAVTGTSSITVVTADGSGENYDITMQAETPGIAPFTVSATISDGRVVTGMGETGIEIDGSVPFVPLRMAVGMELDCGTITVNTGGITTTQTITDNRVVDREEISTAAGTFKCYVVQQKYSAKVMGIKVNGSQKTWYARGIGQVKLETYDSKGKLLQIQLLTGISNR